MLNRKRMRGQLFSTDALLAFVVFAFALVMISIITNQLQAQALQSSNQETARLAAVRMSTTLLSTSGSPFFWETVSDRNTIHSVGLIGVGDAIEVDKWAAFQDWNAADYSSLKQVMGIGDQDFYISILDVNRLTLGVAGIAPTDVNTVAVVSLPSVYQGDPVLVNVQVYKT